MFLVGIYLISKTRLATPCCAYSLLFTGMMRFFHYVAAVLSEAYKDIIKALLRKCCTDPELHRSDSITS